MVQTKTLKQRLSSLSLNFHKSFLFEFSNWRMFSSEGNLWVTFKFRNATFAVALLHHVIFVFFFKGLRCLSKGQWKHECVFQKKLSLKTCTSHYWVSCKMCFFCKLLLYQYSVIEYWVTKRIRGWWFFPSEKSFLRVTSEKISQLRLNPQKFERNKILTSFCCCFS